MSKQMVEHDALGMIVTVDERQLSGFPDTVATISVPYQTEALSRLEAVTKEKLWTRCGKERQGIEVAGIARVPISYGNGSADCFTSCYGGTSWVDEAGLETADGRILRLAVLHR